MTRRRTDSHDILLNDNKGGVWGKSRAVDNTCEKTKTKGNDTLGNFPFEARSRTIGRRRNQPKKGPWHPRRRVHSYTLEEKSFLTP